MSQVEVSILELAKGAILEQINREVEKVMENILDPNTDIKTARKVTVTLSFKPDENRELVSCSAQAKSSLASVKPITTNIIVEADKNGKPRAAELTREDPNQIRVFGEESEPAKVLKLRSV